MAGLKEEAVEFCLISPVQNEFGHRSSRMILIENPRNRFYIKRDQTALEYWLSFTRVKSRLDPITFLFPFRFQQMQPEPGNFRKSHYFFKR